MRISITHATGYTYDKPVKLGLQELRMTPKSRAGQVILRWNVSIEGGQIEARFDDHNNNSVILVGVHEGVEAIQIVCEGEVETPDDAAGVVGQHGGFAPIWYFERETPATAPGLAIEALAKEVAEIAPDGTALDRMHALMHLIADRVAYRTGTTKAGDTGEAALVAGEGVCQDHAHIFIAAARSMALPARYVSGYLLLDDRVEQDAGHAWAEAFLPHLGWVGFDPSNRTCPDARYIRVATGLDYKEAAPISGLVRGTETEALSVDIRVEQ